MAEASRIVCDLCGRSIWGVEMTDADGHFGRVPVVARVTVGQIPDSGMEPVDLGALPGLPGWVRDIAGRPVPRWDLCLPCATMRLRDPEPNAAATRHELDRVDGEPPRYDDPGPAA